MLISELAHGTRRLALVGLAKNTGKTETLAALLRERQAVHARLGVTSLGRDGEARDVLDSRIAKPPVRLVAGTLVATTDALLRASGLPHELLERTGMRTPLGEVQVARLHGPGAIEVAGPSSAEQLRAVGETMLAAGAEQVLIDGAIDRRAASSPRVADALVACTGAVLGAHVDEVVAHTRAAVELARLPLASEDGLPRELLERACAGAKSAHGVLVDEQLRCVPLAARFVLSAGGEDVARLLDEHPAGRCVVIAGALPEAFVRAALTAARPRRRELTLVVADPTKVFLSERSPGFYERQGIGIRALRASRLLAITVNPLAPHAHRFDSAELRRELERAIPGVPVLDVLDGGYAAAAEAAASGAPRAAAAPG